MEAAECGAAALAMVLAYHGLWLPLERLRELCQISRDGTSAAAVLRAARGLGMAAQGWRVEPQALARHAFPAIAFWDMNHFVVIEGVRRGGVVINDPAHGRRLVETAEFDRAFTGVLLTFAPAADFKRGGERPGLLRSLLPRGKGSRAALGFLGIIALCNLLPPIFVPAAGKVFADFILVQHATDWLRPLLLALVGAALLSSALAWLHGLVIARLQRRLGTEAAVSLMAHMLCLPIRFFVQRHVGDIASRMEAAQRLSHSAVVSISSVLFSLMGAVISAAIMMLYDVPMAFACLTFAAVDMAAMAFISARRVDRVRQVAIHRGRLASVALGGIQSIETIKAQGTEGDFFARVAGAQARLLNTVLALERSTLFLTLLPAAMKGLSYAVLLGWGAVKVMDGTLTVGTLIAFLSVLQAFRTPVQTLMSAVAGLQELRGDLERVQDTMRYATALPLRADPAMASGPGRLAGSVALRGLGFAHIGQSQLIDNLDLTIAPGGWVALVGASGSGKSTLARLLAGLLEPSAGEILFDGEPAHAVPRGVKARSIGYVGQDSALFEGTIRENIALWDTTLADSRVIAAAQDAGIHDDIAQRRGQYDAGVAESGRNFSGGQCQRIELARALAPDPSILILDEATSALDPVTEAGIFARLRRRGITALVVSHRLSTVRDCDEILVLDGGRVAQRGTHASLMEAGGRYAELIRAE
jgi:NHLM bacteriocin system ABC transporter peptidase/ATP-binding protein